MAGFLEHFQPSVVQILGDSFPLPSPISDLGGDISIHSKEVARIVFAFQCLELVET